MCRGLEQLDSSVRTLQTELKTSQSEVAKLQRELTQARSDEREKDTIFTSEQAEWARRLAELADQVASPLLTSPSERLTYQLALEKDAREGASTKAIQLQTTVDSLTEKVHSSFAVAPPR